MHGQGLLILNDGSFYAGHFKNDFFHGRGLFYFADGSFYNGQFSMNTQHGFGEEQKGSDIIYKG